MKTLTKNGRVNLAVVIPTYNEAKNIKQLLQAIHHISSSMPMLHVFVCIVDDSSPDNTAGLAKTQLKKLSTKRFHGIVLVRQKKDGFGKAYLHGFRHILDNHPEIQYVLQMDADLSHNPDYIPAFLDLARGSNFDLVIGSRYIKGGSTPDWAMGRKVLSRSANTYTRLLLGKHITDYTGGYNLYAASILQRLDLDAVVSDGYSFLLELKYLASCRGAHIAELPIIFKDRTLGTSKIPKNTALKTFLLVLVMRFTRRF